MLEVLQQLLAEQPGRLSRGRIVILTGAGVSAESGIPTFRGKDGYWRYGSRNYRPEELATRSAFDRHPEAQWRWYLHRLEVCRSAAPNAAHGAVAEFLTQWEDSVLITQNVDGLHGRAGSPTERSYEIHGNLSFMRCSGECAYAPLPIPADLIQQSDDGALRLRLRCRECGRWMRPHVLWFDEYYDETHFRFESSLRAAAAAEALLIVGTTGATNLPNLVAREAVARGALLVVVNPEATVFSELAESYDCGVFVQGTAGQRLPAVLGELRRALSASPK